MLIEEEPLSTDAEPAPALSPVRRGPTCGLVGSVVAGGLVGVGLGNGGSSALGFERVPDRDHLDLGLAGLDLRI